MGKIQIKTALLIEPISTETNSIALMFLHQGQ